MSISNPLTFLDMCQRTQQDCGISGALMTTVSGASGEALRIVSWVSSAWLEIAAAHYDALFFRGSVSFASNTSKSAYVFADTGITAATFSGWNRDSFRVYLTSQGITGETYLKYIPYDEWRDQYLFGALRNTRTRPTEISIAPDQSLCFGPIADNGYTFVGDYQAAPQPLVADSDTPKSVCAATGIGGVQANVPTYWNMMIIYKAMMAYASYENAPEIYNYAEYQYNQLNRRFIANQTPEITGPGALA